MKTTSISLRVQNMQAANQLLASLLHLKKLSYTEPGMVSYEIFQSETDLFQFYVRESWTDRAAFERHFAQPHVQLLLLSDDVCLQIPSALTPSKAIAA